MAIYPKGTYHAYTVYRAISGWRKMHLLTIQFLKQGHIYKHKNMYYNLSMTVYCADKCYFSICLNDEISALKPYLTRFTGTLVN